MCLISPRKAKKKNGLPGLPSTTQEARMFRSISVQSGCLNALVAIVNFCLVRSLAFSRLLFSGPVRLIIIPVQSGSVGRSIDRTVDSSVDRSLDRTVDRSVDRTVDRTVDG